MLHLPTRLRLAAVLLCLLSGMGAARAAAPEVPAGQGHLFWRISLARADEKATSGPVAGSLYVWYRYTEDATGAEHTLEQTLPLDCAPVPTTIDSQQPVACAIPSLRALIFTPIDDGFALSPTLVQPAGEFCVSGALPRSFAPLTAVQSSAVAADRPVTYELRSAGGVISLTTSAGVQQTRRSQADRPFAIKVETTDYLLTDAYTLVVDAGQPGDAFSLLIEDPAALIHPPSRLAAAAPADGPVTACSS